MERRHSPLLAPLVILGVIAAPALWMLFTYNAIVRLDESVTSAWSQVENQYQRRADLVPNLVSTVKGYAGHERATLEAVVKARAEAGKTVVDAAKLTPENMQSFQAAQEQFGNALARLLVSVERYPDLKASTNFLDLQVQLEGSENRIAVERMRFNQAARDYNTRIRSFPGSLLADWFGFAQRPYFTAAKGAANAPVVDFSGASQ